MATERAVRAADAKRLRAENAAQRVHEAAAINDTMVQSVAVAKWALEAGDVHRAVEVLDQAVDEGQRLVTDLLREAGPGHGLIGTFGPGVPEPADRR